MVKCKDCGYFAIRNSQSGEVCSVERSQRETGKDPKLKLGGPRYDVNPFCFVGVYPLADEVVGQKVEFVAAADKERDCDDTGNFVVWIEGLYPKEHFDITWIQEQRKWQERRLKEDRKWNEEQAEKSEARHRATLEGLRTSTQTMLTTAVIGAVAVLAAALAGAALAYLLTHWPAG